MQRATFMTLILIDDPYHRTSGERNDPTATTARAPFPSSSCHAIPNPIKAASASVRSWRHVRGKVRCHRHTDTFVPLIFLLLLSISFLFSFDNGRMQTWFFVIIFCFYKQVSSVFVCQQLSNRIRTASERWWTQNWNKKYATTAWCLCVKRETLCSQGLRESKTKEQK